MRGLVDAHCHILAGLDDGAKSEKDSLALLKLAWESGTELFIATSHGSRYFPKSTPEEIRRGSERLEKRAREELSPEIRIYPGQEILYTDGVLERLEEGRLLTLADSAYVLVEFSPTVSYSTLYRAVRDFQMSGYRLILAHVERYQALREKGRMEELAGTDVWMQLNYGSVGGHWYDHTTAWCRRMLKEGYIQLLSTDMHDPAKRPPRMDAALEWMRRHLDEDYVRELCRENALEIIRSGR